MNRLVDAFGADISEEQAKRVMVLLNTRAAVAKAVGKSNLSPIAPGAWPTGFTDQLESIQTGSGDLDIALRRGIEARVAGVLLPREADQLPDDVAQLTDMIASNVHEITDKMFDDLKLSYSEEAIFEMVFIAAVTVGMSRLAYVWPMLEEAAGA